MFLSENRFKISIPVQNFKHFDIWPGQFQHWWLVQTRCLTRWLLQVD